MNVFRRPLLALAAGCAMLPLAACYDDGYGPAQAYGPPPPPPPPGGYYDAPPPPPPPPAQGGYYRDAPPPRDGYRQAPPPGYDPQREYRPREGYDQAMTRQDYVYRGNDGRYYCRRSDGTTGTVVGAVAGGALGAILGGGGALGTLLGAGGGALLGRSVDQGQVRCH